MDDLEDQMFEQNEMNDVFSRPLGQDAYTTDADLENGMTNSLLMKMINLLLQNWPVLLKKNSV